jgi:hypothetical protein
MSLSRKLTAALDAAPIHPGDPPCQVSAADGGHRIALDLIASGPVGLAFDALDFAAPADPERTTDALRAWADRLAARVTYLMEPLVVLELDPVAGEAELRSQAPSARGSLKSYYEVRLNKAGALRFSRVAFDDASRQRRPAPCQMTREVLERLTDDLVDCAG